MDALINEAIQSPTFAPSSEGNPPPTKRPRLGPSPPERTQEESDEIKLARNELIKLYVRHGMNPDGNPGLEVYDQVRDMTDGQVVEELERMRICLNTSLPGISAHGLLGLFGFFLDRFLGLEGLSDDFIVDPELCALVEHHIPLDSHWSSVPVRIGYRLLDNIVKRKMVSRRDGK